MGAPGERAPRAYYSIYEAADGGLVFLDQPDRLGWVSLCEALERSDLAAAWESEAASTEPTWVRDALDRIFATLPADAWMGRFTQWRVSGGRMVGDPDLLSFPHTVARDLVGEAQAEARGRARVLMPVRWADGTRPGADATPCGPVGADTDAVLRDWLRDPA